MAFIYNQFFSKPHSSLCDRAFILSGERNDSADGLVVAISMAALINPLAMAYLHHHADDEARATIESISSLLERMISIVLGLFFGSVATKINIVAGFWVIGIFVIIIAVVFTVVFHSKRFSD